MTAPTPPKVRRGGLMGVAAGLVGAAITSLSQFADPAVEVGDTTYPWVPALYVLLGVLLTAVRVGFVVLVAALSMSGVSGRSATARAGLVLALLGFAAQALVQLLLLFAAGTRATDPYPSALAIMLTTATALAAVGLLLAGIEAIRSRAWLNWRRFIPLLAGVVTAATVVTLVNGDARNWGMLVWCLVLAVLGTALATQPRVYASRSSIPQR
jgi:hypothetical protein